jgi:hypothetical protein
MTSRVPLGVLVRAGVRIVLIVALLLAAYLFVPINQDSPVTSAVIWASLLALVALIGVFIHQARRINRSQHPLVAGAETLIVVLAIFLIGVAFVYLSMAASAPDAFSEPLNRTGALYFSITVLSTVGFGDITPESDTARWLVSAQMLIDIGFIAGALRLIFDIARRADMRQRANPVDSPVEPDGGHP